MKHRDLALALVVLGGALFWGGAPQARAAGVGGPTLIDLSGGNGETSGGDAGTLDVAAQELRIGGTKVKTKRAPKPPRTADFLMDGGDFDDFDGLPEDIDPDPDFIFIEGTIVVTGSIDITGEENLESGGGDIFILPDSGFFRIAGEEDDGLEGFADDDDDGTFNLDAPSGRLVIQGTVDLSGDDEGDLFGLQGGDFNGVFEEVHVGGFATVDVSGGSSTSGPAGDGGSTFFSAFDGAESRSGILVDEDGNFRVISLAPGSFVDVSGGASGAEFGGDAGECSFKAAVTVLDTGFIAGFTLIEGGCDFSGGSGEIGGGDGGDFFAEATRVSVAGTVSGRGGATSSGPGGLGGNMQIGSYEYLVEALLVAGIGTEGERAQVILDGGESLNFGPAGDGGIATFSADEGDIRLSGGFRAVGGPGTDGGGGGLVIVQSNRGNVSILGDIDTSGGPGDGGTGGNAGGVGGVEFLDPDEEGDPAHWNNIAVHVIALDGSITSGGIIVANGGDTTGALAGDGGHAGDIGFLVDDSDFSDGFADSDDVGGWIKNAADIEANGGGCGGEGRGGDAGDVTFDADGDDDGISGSKAKKCKNTGDVFADGGDAGGSGDHQGGDGGDVLFRGPLLFPNTGEITNDAGSDVGDPSDPAEDGVSTLDEKPVPGLPDGISLDITIIPNPAYKGQSTTISILVHNSNGTPVTGLTLEVRHYSFSLGTQTFDLPASSGSQRYFYASFPNAGPNQPLNIFVNGVKVTVFPVTVQNSP